MGDHNKGYHFLQNKWAHTCFNFLIFKIVSILISSADQDPHFFIDKMNSYLTLMMKLHLDEQKFRRSCSVYKLYVLASIRLNLRRKESYLFKKDKTCVNMTWEIVHAFSSSADFFKNQLFQQILSGIQSECQTVWTQIRPNKMLGLIWIQTVCKRYQQKTLGEKEWICLEPLDRLYRYPHRLS